jgi:uncharacterized protein
VYGLLRFALAVIIISGVNWGLIGFFQFDFVAAIFGGTDASIHRLTFGAGGLAVIYGSLFLLKHTEELTADRNREQNKA